MYKISSEKDSLEAEYREKFAQMYRGLTGICIFVGVVSGLCAFNEYHYYLMRSISVLTITIGIIFAYAALCSYQDVKNLRSDNHDGE
jgi:hypothetical protein